MNAVKSVTSEQKRLEKMRNKSRHRKKVSRRNQSRMEADRHSAIGSVLFRSRFGSKPNRTVSVCLRTSSADNSACATSATPAIVGKCWPPSCVVISRPVVGKHEIQTKDATENDVAFVPFRARMAASFGRLNSNNSLMPSNHWRVLIVC